MTAPSIVDYTTVIDAGSATSRNIDTPTHSEGDAIYIAFATDEPSDTITVEGFTAIYSNDSIDGAATFGLFRKGAGGSEPANYAIATAAPERGVGFCWSVSGDDGIDAQATPSTGNSTTATVPAITSTVADCLRISIVATDRQSVPHGTASGHTKLDEIDAFSAAAMSVHYKTLSSAGTDSAQTVSLSIAEQWIGVTIAIAPASSGHDLTATGVTTGAPSLGTPTVGQVHALSATGVTTGAPTLGTPTAGHVHVLGATGIATGAPTLGTPAVGQVHVLTATDLSTGAPTLGTPTAAQIHVLTATGVTSGSPVLDSPTVAQVHALSAQGLSTGSPALGAPSIGQVHALTAQGITTGAPSLGEPAVSTEGVDAVEATDLATGAPTLGNPFVGQTHVITALGITGGAPTLGTPAAGLVHNLIGTDLATGAPTLGNPFVAQVHTLAAASLLTGAPTLGAPTVGGIMTLPLDRIYTIAAEDRIFVINFEDRTYEV